MDSYLRDLFNRYDSACFFMAGKAWMNGMIPYTEFSDSKGPLLWLIYGIGYLLSPHSYVGVFWLSCLSYAITFCFAYKIAFLFLQNRQASFVASLLMAIPYFIYLYHYETRAEDFCHVFVISSLYALLLSQANPSKRNARICGVVVGAGIGCCLLIKWNIAVMMLSFAGCMLHIYYKNRLAKSYLAVLGASFLIILFPFLGYFAYLGNINDFFREYFAVTTATVTVPFQDMLVRYFTKEVMGLFNPQNPFRSIFLIYNLILIYFLYKHPTTKPYPLLCSLTFLALSIVHDNWGYYILICSSFAIFTMILLTEYLSKKVTLTQTNTLILSAVFSILFIGVNLRMQQTNLFFRDDHSQESYKVSYLMSQIKKPKVVYEMLDCGLGTPVDALPGCKYWMKQNGEQRFMYENRKAAILNRSTDFAVILAKDTLKGLLEASGYTYYTSIRDGAISVYGKPGLTMPPADFKVSRMDILLKRRIFNSKQP